MALAVPAALTTTLAALAALTALTTTLAALTTTLAALTALTTALTTAAGALTRLLAAALLAALSGFLPLAFLGHCPAFPAGSTLDIAPRP